MARTLAARPTRALASASQRRSPGRGWYQGRAISPRRKAETGLSNLRGRLGAGTDQPHKRPTRARLGAKEAPLSSPLARDRRRARVSAFQARFRKRTSHRQALRGASAPLTHTSGRSTGSDALGAELKTLAPRFEETSDQLRGSDTLAREAARSIGPLRPSRMVITELGLSRLRLLSAVVAGLDSLLQLRLLHLVGERE